MIKELWRESPKWWKVWTVVSVTVGGAFWVAVIVVAHHFIVKWW